MKYFAARLFLTSGLALSSFAADPRADIREATRLTHAAFGGPPPEALAAWNCSFPMFSAEAYEEALSGTLPEASETSD